jgi:hypothetical protein
MNSIPHPFELFITIMSISYNGLRIKEVAEGNLAKMKFSLLSDVIWPEGQGCEATGEFGRAILLIISVPLSYSNQVG